MLEQYGDALSIKQYAEIFQCSEWTARELCRRGEIPSFKIGNRVYVPKKQLIEHIEANMTGKAL